MMETTYAMKHQVRSADQVDEITAVRLKHQMLEAGRDQVRSADQVHGDTALEPLKDQVRSADQPDSLKILLTLMQTYYKQ